MKEHFRIFETETDIYVHVDDLIACAKMYPQMSMDTFSRIIVQLKDSAHTIDDRQLNLKLVKGTNEDGS